MIFVDESIQHMLDFICVGFVYAHQDVAPAIHSALREAGMEPGVDEYKSGRRMADLPRLHVLREEIGHITLGCRLAVYIAPISERARLLRVSEILCERHTMMLPRSMYATQEEDAGGHAGH